MYALRRWWDRNGVKLGLISLAIGSALLMRQTQGALVFETYRWLTQPFVRNSAQVTQAGTPRERELEQRLVELESQNRELQKLLKYVDKRSDKGVTAPVIGRSSDHWWQEIILSRGSDDGIQPGFIVSGIGGIVGRVVGVTPHTSRVLLISDPSSKVGVTVSRSRNMGYIRGQSANRVIMVFVDKVPDVRKGDVITTSALSRLFPSGLPVGIVESISFNKSPAPEAVIELSAPISHLEWVIVSPNPKVAEARAVEEEATQPPEKPSGFEEDSGAPQTQLTEYNLPQESIQQFQNRPEAELPAIAPPEPSISPQPPPEAEIEASPPMVPEASSPAPIEASPIEEMAPVETIPVLPAPIEDIPPSSDTLEGSDSP
ncbi:MAG: rod shape-determining protein MreC [Timaviella obliquedivisa GSE-PSE-MK23-08B]|jgi:rod shape-determining protein MreC|nr:rod shape-determining protein MreC [Timaviella obliquedivisa GSE-PSE-MK23-08B]